MSMNLELITNSNTNIDVLILVQ